MKKITAMLSMFSIVFLVGVISCSKKTDSVEVPAKEVAAKENPQKQPLAENPAGNWSKKSPKQMPWADAKIYCENLVEDGSSAWRLPRISELRTLIKDCPATKTGGSCKVSDDCLSNNCWSKACYGCSTKTDGRYSKLGDTEYLWSSSKWSDDSSTAWYVNFERGYVYVPGEDYAHYVRCVH